MDYSFYFYHHFYTKTNDIFQFAGQNVVDIRNRQCADNLFVLEHDHSVRHLPLKG